MRQQAGIHTFSLKSRNNSNELFCGESLVSILFFKYIKWQVASSLVSMGSLPLSHLDLMVRIQLRRVEGEEMAEPIKKEDNNQEKIAKLLPADITAAFLSAKASLDTAYGDNANGYVFWTFVAVMALCPSYFWFVNKVRSRIQIGFMTVTFLVFALSIASKQFSAYLSSFWFLAGVGIFVEVAAIVVPVLWVFVVARIFLEFVGTKVEQKP